MINDVIIEFLEEISKEHFDTSADFLNFCIERIIFSTKSETGYFYYYDESTQKFSPYILSDKCNVTNIKTQYDLKNVKYWNVVIREGKEIIINNYKKNSKSKYHIPLKRLMIIPILSDTRIVAILALVNKKEDYTLDDLNIVKSFMSFLLQIYKIKQKEEKLEMMIKEKEILIKEIFHKVKNSLQLITSLLSIQISAIKDEYYLNLFENVTNRIQVIALTMENIYKFASDTQLVKLQDYYKDIIESFKIENIKINYKIDNINLTAKYATYLGLILNELITNSIKHAFKDIKNPTININIKFLNDKIILNYKDNGNGIFKDFKEGLGSIIIKSLVDQINGDVYIKSNKGYNFYLCFKGRKTNEI